MSTPTPHQVHLATRILGPVPSGSTRPLLVETDGGNFVVKLIGGPDGPPALVAEWIGTQLAFLLGLPTLELARVQLPADLARSIRESELREQVERGAGLCLGLRWLPRARALTAAALQRADDDFVRRVGFLDVWIDNPDRRQDNPNVLAVGDTLLPIDHASALSFHHGWEVAEETPLQDLAVPPSHVFASRLRHLATVAEPSPIDVVSREALTQVTDSVPAEWLDVARFGDATRARAAYVAYLWKRQRALHKLP